MDALIIAAGAVVIIGALWLGILIARKNRAERIKRSLRMKLLLIRLPQQAMTKEKPHGFKEEINASEQLFSILSGSPQGAAFEMAVHNVGEEIHFYVSVDEEMAQYVSRQIEGLFKDAHIEETPEYTIFNPQGYSEGYFLRQHSHYALPIKTYLESDVDTFSPIVSALSKIQQVGEGIAVQVLVRPAAKSAKKNVTSILSHLKKGAKLDQLISTKFLDTKDFKELVTIEHPKEAESVQIDNEAIGVIERKTAKSLLEVNYRILVSGTSQAQVADIARSVVGSFSQFESPRHNTLDLVKARSMQDFAFAFTFRQFDEAQMMTLNSEELASMFHLPSSSILSSKIKWLKSKEATPPADLPAVGTRIGESSYRGIKKEIYISAEDRRRHVYVIGQTGTGKSALMTNMVLEDIKAGKGVCIVDPHGDLVDSILGSMPPERAEDVIVFDPGNIQKPIGLNMLEFDPAKPEEKTFIVNEIQGIFNRLFTAETMGPMFEQYMRNALLLLMEDASEPATLIEVPRIFTDDEFRKRKLARATNPVVLDFWQKEATKVGGEASLNNMAPYITSKFNNFIANDYVRPIIGQQKSSFNFRKIMDEQKILLVSLSKGRIGDINSGLLGMIIVGKLLLSAFGRVDMPQEQRKDFNLYIDEFQNFTTDSISTILSEARKYRLNLTIAHQFIAQLQDKIRDSVFGNVGSMIVFRIGAQDAEFLIKQFEPIFSANDLMNIDNLNAYVKLLVNGQTSKPFNIHTPLYPPQDHTRGGKIKELAFLKYGANRSQVEADILQRLRS